MGQYMSTPDTEKFSEDGAAGKLAFGASAMQGWRMSMEDSHIALPAIDHDRGLFAVFDGHGGSEVALFCKKHMPEELMGLEEYKDKKFDKALIRVFHRMDDLIANTENGDELEMLKHERKSASGNSNPTPEGELDADGASEKSNGMSDSGPEVEITTGGSGNDGEAQTVRLQIGNLNALSILQKLQESKMGNGEGNDANGRVVGHSASGDAIYLPFSGSADGQKSPESGDGSEEAPYNRSLFPLSFMDEQQCRLPDHRITAGCTAVVALVVDGEVIVANAGDSKAVLCRGGTAIGLSFEHKPFNDIERRRIEAAGGFVSAQGRVNNNLNLSRSIGDLKYKGNTNIPPEAQMITSEPDICREKLRPEDEFMLIACDGVWDVMSNQEAIDFVRERLTANPERKLSEICEEIFMACLAQDPKKTSGLGGDNMTAVLVRFK